MFRARHTFRPSAFRPARLRLYAALGLAFVVALACGLTGRAQSNGSNNGGMGGGQGPGSGQGPGQGSTHPYSQHQDLSSLPMDDPGDPMMAARRMAALNIQRQKQLVSDTDKLLKLAKELNDEIAARNTGSLTGDQLRKIAEIEKLARSVRQRMSDGIGQPQSQIPLDMPVIIPNPGHN